MQSYCPDPSGDQNDVQGTQDIRTFVHMYLPTFVPTYTRTYVDILHIVHAAHIAYTVHTVPLRQIITSATHHFGTMALRHCIASEPLKFGETILATSLWRKIAGQISPAKYQFDNTYIRQNPFSLQYVIGSEKSKPENSKQSN